MSINNEIGMLIGVHAGDCLGVTLEFGPPMKSPDFHKNLVGGGAYNFKVGEGSDDTDMMLCLLRSVIDGTWNPTKTMAKYSVWYDSDPADIGMTTARAIQNYIDGENPLECGLTHEHSQGNGSIMRCTPMALLEYQSPDDLKRIVEEQCKLTHGHPVCIECDIAYVNGLQASLNGIDKGGIIEIVLNSLSTETRKVIDSRLDLKWEELPNSGWCVDSLSASLWALLNTNSFEEGVMAVVNRGNDADTGGAVTGGLLGAFYGYSEIPKRWTNQLKSRNEIIELYITNN